jgi:hypothetical protein
MRKNGKKHIKDKKQSVDIKMVGCEHNQYKNSRNSLTLIPAAGGVYDF